MLDGWGFASVGDQARDLVEILEDRYDVRGTIITSQLARLGHDYVGHPTLMPFAIASFSMPHRIERKGESTRKVRPKPVQEG